MLGDGGIYIIYELAGFFSSLQGRERQGTLFKTKVEIPGELYSPLHGSESKFPFQQYEDQDLNKVELKL